MITLVTTANDAVTAGMRNSAVHFVCTTMKNQIAQTAIRWIFDGGKQDA